MVGRGSRRDDAPVGIRSGNVFAALETLKKKKKSDKDKSKESSNAKEPEPPQVFWAPTPLASKSWADVDDEDDDDYYATTAPPQTLWGANPEQQQSKEASVPPEEESESEEEGIDDGDDDIEEEPEPEVPVQSEPAVKKPPLAPLAPKDTERQLSKKELKKKELAELEAVLAELGISGKENQNSDQDETKGAAEGKKLEEHDVNDEKRENAPAPSESKTSKKKKAKKEKSLKEIKDSQEQLNGSLTEGPDEGTGAEPVEQDTSSIDVKERLKKVASMKKKKSNKEMDAAAKAASIEAAARTAKLAAAKKKEKNHYNQQPVR